MRKPTRQGVPKRKPRDMAKPMAEAGKTKDAPAIPPREPTIARPLHDDPVPQPEPSLPPDDTAPDEPVIPEPEQTAQPEPVAQLAPEPEPEPVAEPEPEPEPVAEPEPEPVAAQVADAVPEPDAPPADPDAPPLTMRAMVARVEPAFSEFRDAAYAYPAEHMNDRIGEDGWTRKQMLSHIATWHDLTTDRLIKMGQTGQPVALDRDQDAINNAAARMAIGKSVGEVLKDVEASYAKLRRQMLRMSDADLRLHDGWAAERIAGNTYEHYAEHIADLVPPAPPPGSGAQR